MAKVDHITIKCPECEAKIDLGIDLIGALYHCRECHSNFVAPSTSVTAGAVIGDYWIQSKLGGGIRSEVFLVKRLSDNQRVVLKLFAPYIDISDEHMKGFVNLMDPSIFGGVPTLVPSVDGGVVEGMPYVVSAHWQSEDLLQQLRRVGPFQESKVIETAIACADALDLTWNRMHMPHGMIKPSNVMYVNINEVLITDFGHSQLMRETGNWLTRPDRELMCYLSPEQARGEKLDYRTDMYSLGATLYHVATGAKPIPPLDASDVLLDDESLFPPANEINPNISERVAKSIQHLLSLNPDDRPTSWKMFSTDLRDYQSSQLNTQVLRVVGPHELSPDPVQEDIPQKTHRKRKRKRPKKNLPHVPLQNTKTDAPRWIIPMLAVAMLILVLVFGAVALVHKRSRSPQASGEPAAVTTRDEQARLDAIKRAYDQAQDYARRNPKDLVGAMNRFKEVRSLALGTHFQKMANARIVELRQKRKKNGKNPSVKKP